MFTSLRIVAVAAGVAIGGLVTTVAALVLWALFTIIGVDEAPGAGLVAGLVLGLLAAGYVAGRMAPVFERFHGMVTGLVLAGMIMVISLLGGSPASTPQILLLVAIGIAIGGVGGIVGGRRR